MILRRCQADSRRMHRGIEAIHVQRWSSATSGHDIACEESSATLGRTIGRERGRPKERSSRAKASGTAAAGRILEGILIRILIRILPRILIES